MSNRIKAYFMRVGYQGYFSNIENSLEAIQNYIEDEYIEVISVDGIIYLIDNDMGKHFRLPANRVWLNGDGEIEDIIVGNVLFVRRDENGEFKDIHEDDVQTIKKYFRPCVTVGDGDNFYTIIDVLSEKDLKEWKDG